MSTSSASAAILVILNIIQVIFALAITCVGIWFFVEVHTITSMRNSNHYLLDYNVYWPQAIPWVFVLVGLLVLCVSSCGFIGAKKKNGGFVGMYLTFEVVAIVMLILAGVLGFVFGNSESTNKFLTDAIWDGYTNTKTTPNIETKFAVMERRFQCCGASGPRDYVVWKDTFPASCCDVYYHGFNSPYPILCEKTDKLANERHGCAEVATNYAFVIIFVLSGASIFTAFIGLMNLIVAATLSRSMKRGVSQVTVQQELDSKKVLL